MMPLLESTPENYNISIFRMTRDDIDHIEYNDFVKAFFMMSDVRLISPEYKFSNGEISIFDMSQISYRHFTKVVLSTTRLYLRYIQEVNFPNDIFSFCFHNDHYDYDAFRHIL